MMSRWTAADFPTSPKMPPGERGCMVCAGGGRRPLPHPRGRGVEHFADLVQELPRGEGLLEEVLPGFEHAVVGDRVLGVAGDVEDPHLGTARRELQGELA